MTALHTEEDVAHFIRTLLEVFAPNVS